MNNNSNFFMALLLSALVLIGYHFFFEKPRLEAMRVQEVAAEQAKAAPANAAEALRPRTDIIADGFKAGQRVKIDSAHLHGSLNLKGARIDDLTLADYHITVDKTSPEVVLLAPSGTAPQIKDETKDVIEHGYFTEFGWMADNMAMPDADTVWQTKDTELSPSHPVVLTFDNKQGLVFTRTISLDDNYMFTVADRIENKTAAAVTLHNYALVSRHDEPKAENLFALRGEGGIGVFNGTMQEYKYKALHEDGPQQAASEKGGWAGLTDKYWLVALVPDQNESFTGRMQETTANANLDDVRYQVDVRSPAKTAPAGGTIETTSRLFAGAKEVKLLDAYEQKLGIPRFDLAVDFGWFYFLTKPFFYAIDGIATFFVNTGHGFAWAIILFTVLLKLVFFPLQNKSYIAMNRMKALQPKMAELRERYKDDKQTQNVKLFELYKSEKVNPMAGCWPVLIQIPVFFALYKVLYVSIEMRHAPGWGWINDLSSVDPTNVFNLFGLVPFTPPTFLHLGALPIMMGITMWAQQKMSPASPDPAQAAMFKWMPVIFTFMLASFPAGLVMYWTWSNLLSIIQQYVLLKRHNPKQHL